MRKPFVAGNWKMNKTGEEARALVAEMLPELQAVSSIDRAVCPPFPYLMPIAAMLAGQRGWAGRAEYVLGRIGRLYR